MRKPPVDGTWVTQRPTNLWFDPPLARMSREDRPASRPPLLTSEEWRSLKSICDDKI